MLAKIEEIIFDSIKNLNETLCNKIDLEKGAQAVLYGPQGVIDSIALISLIVDIEYVIEEKFGTPLTLASEKSISQKNSPFQTVHSLSLFIEKLIQEAKNEK